MTLETELRTDGKPRSWTAEQSGAILPQLRVHSVNLLSPNAGGPRGIDRNHCSDNHHRNGQRSPPGMPCSVNRSDVVRTVGLRTVAVQCGQMRRFTFLDLARKALGYPRPTPRIAR